MKNEATERIVPIHKQLLDLGFIDYVNRKKAKLNAENDDFIFPKCKTSGGQYNNKYIQRYLFEFLQTIGVKDINHDFHSFRKNASLAMQSAGLINSIINAIIGWEGEGTMEQSYSNFDLKQIKAEYEKCMAKCMAKTKIKPHLWLRKNVFYCRIELPRENNKRLYVDTLCTQSLFGF